MPIDQARLAATIAAAPDRVPTPANPNKFRGRSTFCEPPVQNIDRNERARILSKAEAIETRTRQRGRHGGALGRPALHVLRTLLLKFLGPRGCFPSIQTLMRATSYCKQTVVTALRRLELAGLIRRIRRVERREVTRVSPVTGLVQSYVGTCQTSNAYLIQPAHGGLSLLAPRPTSRTRVPDRTLPFLEQMITSFVDRSELSPNDRQHLQEPRFRTRFQRWLP